MKGKGGREGKESEREGRKGRDWEKRTYVKAGEVDVVFLSKSGRSNVRFLSNWSSIQ